MTKEFSDDGHHQPGDVERVHRERCERLAVPHAAGDDAGGGPVGDAHAVTEQEDDVARACNAGHRLAPRVHVDRHPRLHAIGGAGSDGVRAGRYGTQSRGTGSSSCSEARRRRVDRGRVAPVAPVRLRHAPRGSLRRDVPAGHLHVVDEHAKPGRWVLTPSRPWLRCADPRAGDGESDRSGGMMRMVVAARATAGRPTDATRHVATSEKP